MAKEPKRKPPSRLRYEQSHPTVSCRVPRDIYERLEAVKKAEGKSFADILRIGLGILEVKAEGEAVARRRGYIKGRRDGFANAEHLYKVTYPCSVCGEMLTVTTGDEKEAIRRCMREHEWGHKECHERRR